MRPIESNDNLRFISTEMNTDYFDDNREIQRHYQIYANQ